MNVWQPWGSWYRTFSCLDKSVVGRTNTAKSDLLPELIFEFQFFFLVMRLQIVESRSIQPISFPSPEDVVSESSKNSYSGDSTRFWLDTQDDKISLPPEALLENSENGYVKVVFFSYTNLHDLIRSSSSQPHKVSQGCRFFNKCRIYRNEI